MMYSHVLPNSKPAVPAGPGKPSFLAKIEFGALLPVVRIFGRLSNVKYSRGQCPEERLMAARTRKIPEPIARYEIWNGYYAGRDHPIDV
jgi:hypothetical protein